MVGARLWLKGDADHGNHPVPAHNRALVLGAQANRSDVGEPHEDIAFFCDDHPADLLRGI